MIVPGLPNFTWVIQLRYMYMDKESQSYLMTKHNITLPLLGSNQRSFLLAKVYDHWAMCSTCLKSINNSETRSFTFQSGSRSTVYIECDYSQLSTYPTFGPKLPRSSENLIGTFLQMFAHAQPFFHFRIKGKWSFPVLIHLSINYTN